MKIALIANHNTPVIKKEGTLHDFIFHFIFFLLKKGHDVTLFAIEGSIVPCKLVFLDQVKNSSKMFYEEKSKEDYIIHTMNYAIAFQTIENGDFDMIHGFNQHYLSVTLGNSSSIPFVVTLVKPTSNRLKCCLELQNWNNTFFVCASETLKNSFKEYLPDALVIYNGVKPTVKTEASLKEIIVWDGVIEENTELEAVVKFAENNCFKVLLMGPISNIEYFEECLSPEIKKGSLKYIGDISGEMKRDIFINCKIYVNAHKEEIFDYHAILKAVTSGTFVVAWQYGTMTEIIKEDFGILCPKGDYVKLNEGIKRAMAIVLQKRTHRDEIDEFTQDYTMESYIELYHKILKMN